jgi:hypothetical protein
MTHEEKQQMRRVFLADSDIDNIAKCEMRVLMATEELIEAEKALEIEERIQIQLNTFDKSFKRSEI